MTLERLLLHYPPRNLNDKENRAVADDWLEDLAEYPADLIAEAARLWRLSGERWSPTTAGPFIAPVKPILSYRKALARTAGRLLDAGPIIPREAEPETPATPDYRIGGAFLRRMTSAQPQTTTESA